MESTEACDQRLTSLVAIVTGLLGLLYLLKTLWKPEYPDNIPPFPAKPYPVIGHIPYLAKGQRQAMKEFRKRLGNKLKLNGNVFCALKTDLIFPRDKWFVA